MGQAADTASPVDLLAAPIRNIARLTTRCVFRELFPTLGTVYQHTFANPLAVIRIICFAHCFLGMTGVVNVSGSCAQSGWSAGPDMPTVLVRAVGVYFQPNGNFYTVGGRTSDTAGSDFQHVLQYSPGSNSWTQKAATLPDNQMNNMACGVLSVSGTPSIYCVGGSAAGADHSHSSRILLQPGDRYCGHLDRRRLAGCHGNNSTRRVYGG